MDSVRHFSVRLLCIFVVVSLAPFFGTEFALSQPRVTSIEFRGLERTRISYVLPYLETQRGGVLDSSIVASDVQSLHNLQLFASVDSRVIPDGEGVSVIFNVRERITRIPITNFGGITDNFWFQLGINEYNWLGRGAYFGGYYQFYDRHSFKVFQQIPQLFSERWGMSYTLGRQATREPAYFQESTSEFDVDRWEATAFLRHEAYRNLHRHESIVIEFGGGYLNEIYDQRPGATFVYAGDSRFDKLFLSLTATYQRLNYYSHNLSGVAHRLTLQRVQTFGVREPFLKLLSELRLHARVGQKANPSIRVRTGISSNEESPFVPFVLDSYLNVRGSGNRVARGTAEFTVNVEHRHTLLELSMGAIQGVAFIDLSAWRPAGTPIMDMFDMQNMVSFGGGGLRLHVYRIYNFTLRVDYGLNLSDSSMRGFVLGVGQYF